MGGVNNIIKYLPRNWGREIIVCPNPVNIYEGCSKGS